MFKIIEIILRRIQEKIDEQRKKNRVKQITLAAWNNYIDLHLPQERYDSKTGRKFSSSVIYFYKRIKYNSKNGEVELTNYFIRVGLQTGDRDRYFSIELCLSQKDFENIANDLKLSSIEKAKNLLEMEKLGKYRDLRLGGDFGI